MQVKVKEVSDIEVMGHAIQVLQALRDQLINTPPEQMATSLLFKTPQMISCCIDLKQSLALLRPRKFAEECEW